MQQTTRSEKARRVGRPSNQTHAREHLIHHARELFTVMAYDKVSTRLIAQRAGVNSAMISYYFGNKEGLFETMLRETLAPVQQKLNTLIKHASRGHFIDIMRTYYREMVKVPQFPRLVMQLMNMPPSDTQRKLMEKVFMDISKPMQDVIFDRLVQEQVIRPDMDPKLCRISYISLMVFPFMAPPSMLALHGVELSDEFLDRLFEHNIRLMTSGFLTTSESNASG
ncbi:TetR/AcrR family transcriptional regulator [Vibrio proteolyticus]|uniref:TetR/AcrR family transcriptional regulator n=1 Tax=Vibrio proteolyticus TaxID=671 RepID=UPI000594AFB0|nr:TetR family transcriptional regulator [Vibrio proteolyticus]